MMYTHARQRRGAVLAIIIVALLVMLIIGTALVRMGWIQRRQMTVEERHTEAEWLAESGIERAWVQLQASDDYMGETWKIDSADLAGRGDAVVTISVTPMPGREGRKQVRAIADYPRDVTLSARTTKVLIIDRKPTSKPETSP